jgi:alpha-glucosidase
LAGAVDRYLARAGDLSLEVSAPRADIVRVRAGQDALPQDASWAVIEEARHQRVVLNVDETEEGVVLRTGELRIRIDGASLAVTVENPAGEVVLADAPGAALVFEGGGFRLRKAMEKGVRIFGLGDKTGSLDRRGGAFTFWNTDAFEFGADQDPLYKTIPFAIGTGDGERWFGLFVDNTWRAGVDVGRSEPDVLSFAAEGGPVDYYVFAGTTPKAVVEAYTWLTGRPPLASLWSLGFQQSRWSYLSQAEVESIADRLRAEAIPADALYLDIDFQDHNRPFTVNTAAFPDLADLALRLAGQGLKLVAITDLHIAAASGEGYVAYDTGASLGAFLRDSDGGDYVGEVWPGPSVFPDFSRPAVRRWWGGLYSDLVAAGVAGFWNDMNEPAIFNTASKTMPPDVVHRIEEPGFSTRQASHAQMHNVYGSLNARATYEGTLRLRPERRPFVLTRAAYAGGQRHAATWTGDNLSSFEHLALSIRQLIGLGLGGFAYCGADVGGFGGPPPSADLLTRWIQVGAFTPLFRIHCKTGRPPQEVWVHGPRHTAIRRRAIEARYRLMPYLYGVAEENSRTGLPILRPVFMDFPRALGPETDGQFMLGPDLLIAMPPPGDDAFAVTLPGEGWFDYWTGASASRTAIQTPTLERLPVFVRPGAVLARQPLVQSTAQTPQGPIELAVYPGAVRQTGLYFDDGVSFAYREGVFLRQAIRCEEMALVLGPREGGWRPWWTDLDVKIHGWRRRSPVARLDGRSLAGRLDAARETLTLRLPDLPNGGRLEWGP